jgi:hypothetical protein
MDEEDKLLAIGLGVMLFCFLVGGMLYAYAVGMGAGSRMVLDDWAFSLMQPCVEGMTLNAGETCRFGNTPYTATTEITIIQVAQHNMEISQDLMSHMCNNELYRIGCE